MPVYKPLVEQFRAAVSSGEFARAEELWKEVATAMEVETREGRAGALREVQELMEWTRTVVVCFRSQALQKLRTRLTRAHAVSVYAQGS
jgi:hypothetical protein